MGAFARGSAKAFKTINRAIRKTRLRLKTLDKAMGRFHKTLKKTGTSAAAMGAVGAAALYKIGSAGADFEEAISAVGAVGLQTRDQIADLEKEALRLGSTTKFTATEAANAMETMARAGFSNQEILAGVGGVLDAAAASGLEIAEVANHVSNALKGMGLEVTDAATGMSNATRVADVLALASSRTNSSIGSLGESLKNVAGTASDLGMSIEDTIGAVALLQDVGLDASVAGSALNTMLTEIAAGSTEVSKRAKDAHGNMRSFPELLAIISDEAAKSGGNMDRVAYLADLVGLRGQKAATNLAKLFDSGKVASLTDELNKAAGSAQKMAELRMDNLKGDLTLLESAVDGVKVALFNLESGALREVVQGWTKWVDANKDLITSKAAEYMVWLRKNQEDIVKWLKRIGYFLAVFYALSAAVKVATLALVVYNGVAKTVVGTKKALALAGAVYTAVTKSATAATLASAVASKVAALGMLKFLGVIGLVGAAIAAVVAALDQLLKLVDEVGGWGGLWEGVKSTFTQGSFFAGVDEHMNKQARERAKGAAAREAATGGVASEIGAIGTEGFMKGILDQIPALEKDLGGVGEIGGSAFMQSIIDTMPGLQAELDRLNVPRIVIEHQAVGGSDPGVAQMVSPSERVAHSISETTATTKAEVTVKAPPGSAVTKPPKGNGFGLKVQPSGAM